MRAIDATARNLDNLAARGWVHCLSRQTAEEFRAAAIERGWNPEILVLEPTRNGCSVTVFPLC